jgi:hypothetical protein
MWTTLDVASLRIFVESNVGYSFFLPVAFHPSLIFTHVSFERWTKDGWRPQFQRSRPVAATENTHTHTHTHAHAHTHTCLHRMTHSGSIQLKLSATPDDYFLFSRHGRCSYLYLLHNNNNNNNKTGTPTYLSQ